ncbi:MAG TPA: bacillithiol system redox-active protein YtxJ [Flavobacterium lutivivi]|nr:bacillithiol system redox-active protein YtxJ [Flavobacterium lutivivi]
MNWLQLTEIAQLDNIIEISKQKSIVIFKHSTRCFISKSVLRSFEAEYVISSDKMDAYYLDLLNYRDISNEIATRFNVVHQSPQILVIINGVCVHHASHENIQADDLEKFV